MAAFNIKANRTFTFVRKWAWIFTIVVAIGGLWYPRLGLLVIPIILSLSATAFFRGRFWCGNFCPHGSLYDTVILKFTRNKNIPWFFKSKLLAIAFFSWFAYRIISKLIKAFGLFGTASFYNKVGLIFVTSYLMVLIIGVPLALFITPRTWCRFCPMGMMQILSYKLGKLLGVAKKTDKKITIASQDMCHSCGKCSRVCPMQLKPYLAFSDKNQFDEEKCIRCSTCVVNCPAGILSLKDEKTSLEIKNSINITGFENRQKIESKIIKIQKLKDDVTEYTFKFIKPEKVNYKAGQFILVNILEEPHMNRAYSISSYNEDDTILSVTVKNVKDGYGTEIMSQNLKVGDSVTLEGPMGHELVVDKTAKNILLVGGGIGITPFLPIVKDILSSSNSIEKVSLVYGANYENEFLYDNEFTALSNSNDKFEFTKVAAFDKNYKGNKGFVTDIIKNLNLSDSKVYMCGPKPMINAAKKLLKEKNIDDKNIFVETA
ncbi:benzoate 1,2-dioxygenase electron transfer component [Clostridium homopropionicum DSM 5847]|uniref:Benzoate 1,2-dioxygenase electron transfer component n=1 Tax=Clostridium homopropionicum DSM 5847 TaxID=1121318 RepID=A0A0L6ZCW0_9CLOT|nr:FAD-binding oxidoreductase [Clostridium homopropionicum]KOA20782.1 benzoate 1,2-dioxygenase electron transfer component [Clostridium homopropionicum DSM 5847]SFF89279.1 Ferredoxin-NADP reductase [Clostridium homopropionicum]